MLVHPPVFVVAPIALIAALLLAQVGLRAVRDPSVAAAKDLSAPVRLPRASPAPSDPEEFRLHHAARMIRRADAAAAIGQFDHAIPWLSEARASARPVAGRGATRDRRRRARDLSDLASRRLQRLETVQAGVRRMRHGASRSQARTPSRTKSSAT